MTHRHAATLGMPSCAVVGAGVLGLCTAILAQRRGLQVTLYDRQPPGLGASYGNAGYLACELIDPLSTPATLRIAPKLWLDPNGPLALPLRHLPKLIPWLVRFVGAARPAAVASSQQGLRALNQASVPAWRRLLSPLGLGNHLVQSGYMLVWESENKQAEARSHAERLASCGISTRWLDRAALIKMEPEMGPQLSCGLFFPEAYRVQEPYSLVSALYDAFIQAGGTFVEVGVKRVQPVESDGVLIEHSEGEQRFDKAVICAGAWSRSLMKLLGLSVPVEAERGYHLTYRDLKGPLNYPMGSAERRFVMTPLESGLRVVGMSELGGLTLAPFKKRYDVLKRHACALIPGLKTKSEQCEFWMGHRPTLPDSLPVIDRHPHYRNIGFAFGNQHLGLTQAAVSAELLWKVMENEPTEVDMNLYRVNRF